MRVLGLLLLLSLAACAPPEMIERTDSLDQANNSTSTISAAAKRGKTLYATYCSSCHGAEGLGGSTWPGNIQGFDPIETIVKNGRGTMPPIPVTSAQSGDIQAYLNSFVVAANNTTGSNGKLLFDKYCSTCHGPEGTGAAIWTGNIQGYDPINDIVKNGRGTMAAISAATDPEIAEIQTYLNSFGVDISTLSGIETFANQCASCHGAEGEGTSKGPVIQLTSSEYAKWVTRNGRTGVGYPAAMIAYGPDRVTDAQLDEIIDFLHAQTRPTTGEALHATLCANCHGTGDQNGPASESLAGRVDSTADIRSGHGGTNHGSRRIYMPKWSAAELSDAEIDLINAYLSAL